MYCIKTLLITHVYIYIYILILMSCSHGFQPGTICYKYPRNPRFEMAATRHVRLPRTVCKCENSSAVNLRNVTMSCGIYPTFHHILPSHSLKLSLQKHPGTNKPTNLPNISTRFLSCSTHAMPVLHGGLIGTTEHQHALQELAKGQRLPVLEEQLSWAPNG